jgi:ribosomal-protein-alanine N-acetyltransferase
LPSKSSTESTPIGSIGSPRPGELGYMFHPSYWGKGYATEVLKAFLNTYYEVLGPGIGKIVAHTDVENEGSKRVLVKCGFKEVRREPWENVTLGTRESVIFEYSPFEKV